MTLSPADRLARLAGSLDPSTAAVPEAMLSTAPQGAPAPHPDLSSHVGLGLSATHAHPFEPSDSVATHAQTPHGLASHAIDGAFHSGSEVLPTPGQKNALAGTSGTPGSLNPYVTTQDGRLSDARTPLTHTHPYEPTGAVAGHSAAADPHPVYLTQAEAGALYAALAHTHGGGACYWSTIIEKPSDTSRAATITEADDPDLRWTVGAGETWAFELRVTYAAASATPDLKFRLRAVTGTMQGWWRYIGSDTTANAILAQTALRVAAQQTTTIAAGTNALIGDVSTLLIDGQMRFSAAGVVAFQWAQSTSNASPTIVKARSTLAARRIA